MGTDSITKMDVDDPEDVDAVHLALKKLLQDTFVNDFTSEDYARASQEELEIIKYFQENNIERMDEQSFQNNFFVTLIHSKRSQN